MGRNTKIVLTGGPCAGKTTLASVIARAYAHSVIVLPEAASLLFSGGFPRWEEREARHATQRAIFFVQRELENAYEAKYPDRILVLDRSTVDGAVYWPDGPEAFYAAMGTSREAEFARYDRVIYLESADQEAYQLNLSKNPHRRESWEEARALDEANLHQWEKHPALTMIRNQRAFGHKVSEVLSVVAGSSQGSSGQE